MSVTPRKFLTCPICRNEAPTHKDDVFRLVFSRHPWFMSEGRCPGSLTVVAAVGHSPKLGGHL